MPKRNLNYYLLKLARLSGWVLLPLMLVYLATGFALCGHFGFSRLIDLQTALLIHQIFDWPLIVAFSLHASTTVYFAMWRWGWIKRRNKK